MATLLRIILAFAVIGWIWLPEFLLWHVQPATVTTEIIEHSRTVPQQSVLNELSQINLQPPANWVPSTGVAERAENVAKGILDIPDFPSVEISPVFSPADLQKHPQLLVASLVAVDQLLDGYLFTGKEKYFHLAKESLIKFSEFESSRFFDTGFLWNDHAIAARISVLIKFWAHYRNREDFDLEDAKKIFLLVTRSGLLLAKSEQYAWRTGHGILADLALMQISTAFPFLSESNYFRETAIRRFSSHLPYYVNNEGVTLLHSAGYNFGGVQFLATMLRLYTLNNLTIPIDWWERYNRVSDFYARLRRPDGTMPMFGDTSSKSNFLGPPRTYQLENGDAGPLQRTTDWPYHGGLSLYPQAGHAIWWYPQNPDRNKTRSQTVTTWSYYPQLGHKQADELSILTWAEGRSWITSVGYWPYGSKGRSKAESWGGNNAPHLRNEAASSQRTSRLISTGNDDEIFFIEMERKGPDGFKVLREVMQIGAKTWIIFDHLQNEIPREANTFWTFYPDLTVVPGLAAGSFTVSAPYSAQAMYCSFQTDQGRDVEQLFGSWEPFAGWVTTGQVPVPAETIAVNTNSEQGWQLAVFSLRSQRKDLDDRSVDLVATLTSIDGPDDWVINISGIDESDSMTISRNQNHINLLTNGKTVSEKELKLTKQSTLENEAAFVSAAIGVAAENSTRQLPLISYRLKATYVLLAILIMQEILFFILRRRLPRLATLLRTVSIFAWIGVGLGLTEFYFVVKA
ncbi:hypothetical protein ABO04_07690 [Nitrosomonas sp. HPC101]|uniref:heparinase II/III family protein n=1 Tax=Nitrosomonas sp. HPC101 TaxID=1658667 RepID=UPI00136D9F4B|nr:heparinase II/III family protein [Nitrosomonas sp. HPC101]MXS85788.1 hypothetical protein [Nitrosomonas sp. HPC101]